MKKLFFAAALAGTMLGGTAFAGQAAPTDQAAPGAHGGHGRGGMMARADTNGDGMISRAEYMAQAEARFARMDKNGDAEHKITHADFMAKAEARFAKLDANGDGQISPDEMKAAMERMHERMGGRHGPGGAMMPPPPGGPGGPGHHGPGMFERLDTNHDGKISRDEMRAPVDRHFDKLDTNHDGFIDQAEMEAAHAKMKAMRDRHWHRGPGGNQPMPSMGAPDGGPGANPSDLPQPGK